MVRPESLCARVLKGKYYELHLLECDEEKEKFRDLARHPAWSSSSEEGANQTDRAGGVD